MLLTRRLLALRRAKVGSVSIISTREAAEQSSGGESSAGGEERFDVGTVVIEWASTCGGPVGAAEGKRSWESWHSMQKPTEVELTW